MDGGGDVRGRVLVAAGPPGLAGVLRAAGFETTICPTAADAAAALSAGTHIAVLVGWRLPDRPGADFCRHVRQTDELIPIIVVSDPVDGASPAAALAAGADDFVFTKVADAELVARLEAHLRKSAAASRHRPAPAAGALRSGPAAGRPGTPPADDVIAIGDVRIDTLARAVHVGTVEVSLGALEFRLLEYFARSAGIAISREQVLNEVYGYDADISTERVDLLVRRLRAKLGEGPRRGGLLVAVPGFGYRLERRRDR